MDAQQALWPPLSVHSPVIDQGRVARRGSARSRAVDARITPVNLLLAGAAVLVAVPTVAIGLTWWEQTAALVASIGLPVWAVFKLVLLGRRRGGEGGGAADLVLHAGVAAAGVGGDLADQPGLAHPGLAVHQGDGPAALGRGAERVQQGRQLGAATDERGCRDTGRHDPIIAPTVRIAAPRTAPPPDRRAPTRWPARR